MKRVLIVVAASAAFLLPTQAGVLAQSPQPTITVEAEPPGDNCEFGGVKVTVTPADEPTPTPEPTDTPDPEPTDTPEPTPTDTPSAVAAQAAEPDVEYVCNGQPGEPGQDGSDGMDGQDGQDGQDGLDGMDSDASTPGIQASRANTCATAGVKRVRLPKRFKSVKRVTVTVNSQRKHPVVKRRVVKVSLRRVPCGYYPVLVQKRHVRSYLVVLRLTPTRVTRSTVK